MTEPEDNKTHNVTKKKRRKKGNAHNNTDGK